MAVNTTNLKLTPFQTPLLLLSMAPITAEVYRFDDTYFESTRPPSREGFTFESQHGIDLNKIPLNLKVGEYWIITKGDPWRLWKNTKWEVNDNSVVMYRAHCMNFYLTSESAHILSMGEIIERGLLTWEEDWPHPLLMVISTNNLVYTLCRPWQMSIKEELGRWSHVAWVRLRQIVTGSKKFQVGFLDYNYTPNLFKHINTSPEDIEHTYPPGSPVFTMASSSHLSSTSQPVDFEEERDGYLAATTQVRTFRVWQFQ